MAGKSTFAVLLESLRLAQTPKTLDFVGAIDHDLHKHLGSRCLSYSVFVCRMFNMRFDQIKT